MWRCFRSPIQKAIRPQLDGMEGADPRFEVDDSAYDLVSMEVHRCLARYSEFIIGPFGLTPFPKQHSHELTIDPSKKKSPALWRRDIVAMRGFRS